MSTNTTTSSDGFVAPSNGIAGGYKGDNETILRAMTAFTAIAWYNAIEIIFLTLLRFKKYEGLYFYSLLVTAIAIIVYQLGSWGNMLQLYEPTILFVILQNIGWIFMVVGQSLVLYSRLHIMTHNKKALRFVLWMIILNSTLMYIPTTTLNFLEITDMTNTYANGYNTMERIQMTLFSLQEIIISAIYLWEVRNFTSIIQSPTRKVMIELVIVNIALILLDVALLSVEFVNLYEIETTLKGMVYSIKLKLEIGVLSRMVKVVQQRQCRETRAEDIDLRKYSSAQMAEKFFTERKLESEGSADGGKGGSGRFVAQEERMSQTLEAPPPDVLEVPSGRPEASKASSTQSFIDGYPGMITGS